VRIIHASHPERSEGSASPQRFGDSSPRSPLTGNNRTSEWSAQTLGPTSSIVPHLRVRIEKMVRRKSVGNDHRLTPTSEFGRADPPFSPDAWPTGASQLGTITAVDERIGKFFAIGKLLDRFMPSGPCCRRWEDLPEMRFAYHPRGRKRCVAQKLH